jgi:hypothetical protein
VRNYGKTTGVDAEVTASVEQQNHQSDGLFRSILLPLSALALALCGQWLLLESDKSPLIGALFFVAAINLYLLSLVNWPHSALVPEVVESFAVSWRPIIKERQWRAVLVVNALILAIASYGRFSGNALDKGFWTWLASIALFLIAFVYVPDCSINELSRAIVTWWRGLDKHVLLLLMAVMLLALFFRFYRLQDVPLEMTSDHAEKILDIQDVLDGSRPIFFPRNTGRELFQFYLTAGLIRLTGLPNSHLALKVGTAIFGFVAVPFTFLLGRLLYGHIVGLLAAIFLAVSHWHVAITRIGLRFPFTAAFVTPMLFFLLRALRKNRRNDWLFVGFFLGVGLHTYTAMRIAPVLCVVLVGIKLLIDGIKKASNKPIEGIDSWTGAFWKNGFLALCLTLLYLLPLLRYMIDDPQGVWIRSLSRAQSDSVSTASELAIQFLENIKNTLFMFHIQGDVVSANTIPNAPVLGLVSGALLVLGLAYLVWRLFASRDIRSLLLLVCLFFLLLPSMLSLAYPAENPSVVRTGGAIPVVMIIAAIPLATTILRLQLSTLRYGILVAFSAVFLLILVATLDNYGWYFRDYDAHYRRTIWNTTELGAVLRAFDEEGADITNAYHVPYPHWVDTRNIGINAGHVRWNNALADTEVLDSHVNAPRPRLYLLHPHDLDNLRELQRLFPDGTAERYNSPREGKDFIIFRIPANTWN